MQTIPLDYSSVQSLSKTIFERFWKKVIKTDSCWIWIGGTNGSYGFIWISGKTYIVAPRLSWIIHRGEIPNGLNVLHDCPGGDNPLCVNPDHLWIGTAKENTRDAVNKGRWPQGQGQHNGHYKLTEEQVIEIRSRIRTVPLRVLAKSYGVSISAMGKIITGKSWNHLS